MTTITKFILFPSSFALTLGMAMLALYTTTPERGIGHDPDDALARWLTIGCFAALMSFGLGLNRIFKSRTTGSIIASVLGGVVGAVAGSTLHPSASPHLAFVAALIVFTEQIATCLIGLGVGHVLKGPTDPFFG